MATAIVTADSSAYVLASSASDFIVQNIGVTPVIARFDTSLPAASAKGHTLYEGTGIQKSSGVPSGNLYVRTNDNNSDVAVTE